MFVAAVLVMLFEHCARIPGSISGGPKDETPPRFVQSAPPNYSTNFNAKRIEISFDEWLQLKDVNNQFYSSPPMMKTPEILLYGRTVRVTPKEPLLPDITYMFDFGSSITDLNEGNVTTGFLYVFSTGDHIDSLTFTGRVLNAFNLKPGGKDDKVTTWVMLYDDLSDSAVYRHTPTYITRADEMGFFTFSHIRPDTFRIFALRDMGGNLIFDNPTERIAFSDTLIVTDQHYYYSTDSLISTSRNTPDSIKEKNPELLHVDIMLYQFEEKPSRQYRMAYERKESNMLRFVYSMPVDSIGIDILEYDAAAKWYEMETSVNKDTLDYWLTDTAMVNQKTLMVHLYSPRTDSLNNLIYTDDTLKLTFEEPRQPQTATRMRREQRENENQPKPRTAMETMNITTNVKSGGTMELTDRMQLIASQPIKSADASKIILQEQVDTLKKTVAFTFSRDSVNVRKAYVDWTLKEDTKYFLTIDTMSFLSIYGVFSDSTGMSFTTQKEEYYSILEITFDSIPCPLVVQALKGDKEDVVKQVTLTEGNVATIDYLKPDKYKIKIIFDANGNGKWDTGDYLKKIQPEKVAYFSEPEVETHSNVKTELQWSLNVRNKKEEIRDDEDDGAETGNTDQSESLQAP
jgi:hypothetical protein